MAEAEIQQPTPLIDVWELLPEEARMDLFPLLTGADRRRAMDLAKTTFDSKIREEEVARLAGDNLLYRDAKRAADRLERERNGAASSWEWVDLGELYDKPQQAAEVGSYAGTGGVFYTGKVNEVHGGSESGKTMFVLAVAAQEIKAGNSVVMYDFEDDAGSIVGRLRFAFGLTREEIDKHFRYANPLVGMEQEDIDRIASLERPTMCIIDAVTESMAIDGLNGRIEAEVAAWYHSFPKRLAKIGTMAVVLIDHTSKTDPTQSLGSQHKKSAVDGVSYTAESVHPFVKGELGRLRIRVAKDKIGSIRPAAARGSQQKDGQRWRGDFVLDSRGDTATWEVTTWQEDEAGASLTQPAEAPATLPTITEDRMPYLRALSTFSDEMATASDIADKINEAAGSKVTYRQLARRMMIKLKEDRVAAHPVKRTRDGDAVEDKAKWIITPTGVQVIANEEINKAAIGDHAVRWAGRRRPVSGAVSPPPAKLDDDYTETD